MRDPHRIDPMLALLARVWRANPDLRLGQIVVNAGRGEPLWPDVFNVEDDVTLSGLQRLAADLPEVDAGADSCPTCHRPPAKPGTGEGCERAMYEAVPGGRAHAAHIMDCERAGRLRAEAEVLRLHEAAAAPLVHLAAGQVAIWPWQPSIQGWHVSAAVSLPGPVATTLVANESGNWYAAGYGGGAPDLASAKAAAEAAVVELTRKGASDGR